MHTCSLFTSTIDIVFELKRVASTTLLHDYRKYSPIISANKISKISVLSNENSIKSQTSNRECNAEHTIIECLETAKK